MSWCRGRAHRHDASVLLIDELRREHDLIDRLLGSLRTFASRFAVGSAAVSDGLAMLHCLASYAGGWHHEREEGVLFPALAKTLPADRGPIAAMLADHHSLADSLVAMRESLIANDPAAFSQLAIDYTRLLWAHIDAENSVLFPESEIQLRRNGIRQLEVPETPDEIVAVAKRAEELISRYPGTDAADVIRGDGCVMCPVYGDTCRGIEREWWNDWEWEELEEHVANA